MKTQDTILSTVSYLNRTWPQACSLSLGRPNPDIYTALRPESYRKSYEDFLRHQENLSAEQISEHLYTYGPSQGIINGHLARWLEKDEAISVSEKDIFITNGCQEAYNLILLSELKTAEDAVLIIEPAYFGFSDVVAVLGKTAVRISVDDIADENGEMDFSRLHAVIKDYAEQGKRIRLIYINPDFNNPMTYRLSAAQRQALLNVCQRHAVEIIEDSTYSGFCYDGEKSGSIKSQDRNGLVWHVGSVSKIMCPSLRLGYLVLPRSDDELSDRLRHIKDHTSLSTSAFNQQIVAGFLLEQDYSLENWLHPLRDGYRARRDAMAAVLAEELVGMPVSWQQPTGGFFIWLRLPIEVGIADLMACASDYQVTFLPVSYFSQRAGGQVSGIRLAFSYYPPAVLREATKRFCSFLKEKLFAAPVEGRALSGAQQRVNIRK